MKGRKEDENADNDQNRFPETRSRRRKADRAEFEEFEELEVEEDPNLSLNDERQEPPKRLPRAPLSLLPLEDFEKSEIQLSNKNGEMVGRKDDFRYEFFIFTIFFPKFGTWSQLWIP